MFRTYTWLLHEGMRPEIETLETRMFFSAPVQAAPAEVPLAGASAPVAAALAGVVQGGALGKYKGTFFLSGRRFPGMIIIDRQTSQTLGGVITVKGITRNLRWSTLGSSRGFTARIGLGHIQANRIIHGRLTGTITVWDSNEPKSYIGRFSLTKIV